MKRLYLLCLLAAAVLIGLSTYYRAEPDTFYGIADAKEIVVSSESAVEIRRLPVVPGQHVQVGDTLLELHNPELEMRISQIAHELSELRARKSAHASLSKSEILQLKAQQEERASEIRAEIRELEAQYEMNRELVSELRSIERDKAGKGGESDARNPILVKIESLRKLLELAQDPSRVYESRLANALSSDGDPLVEQVARLEDELRILGEDRKRQVIVSQLEGLVGSVDFKAGEKVSPFTPILTVHSASPSFVRGYIHEDVYSQVKVKQKVQVRSNQDRRHKVEGVVVGVGARIVEYPERLRKRPDILIWGREIIIRLPAENRFLLGEKVLISMPTAKHALADAAGNGTPAAGEPPDGNGKPAAPHRDPPSADPEAGPGPARDIAPARTAAAGAVAASAGAADIPGIEASGLLYLPDLGRFLVISDDNPRKSPLLHLVDREGRLGKSLPIAGLDKMDDMEAVSGDGKDGGFIWVMSSQSRTKGGKLPEPRKLLVKARRQGETATLAGKLNLYDLLEKLAAKHADRDWAAFLKAGTSAKTLDIEGMAVRDGSLYLGFKAPLLEGKAVILKLDGADSLVAGRELASSSISIWKTMDLADQGLGIACGIADLAFSGGDAWLVSTGDAPGPDGKPDERRHAGALWVLRQGAAAPERVRDFGGEKPEGLAVADGVFYAVFDNGSGRPSQLLRLGELR